MKLCSILLFWGLVIVLIDFSSSTQIGRGVDLGLKRKSVPNVVYFDPLLTKECIDVIRCYHFFVGVLYEVISTSNCLSEETDVEVRTQLSRRLSELNYYGNFLAEAVVEKGGNATFFENLHELPKRKASFRSICHQLRLINAKETYFVGKVVLRRLLRALSELKKSFIANETHLESSPLISSFRNKVVFILNLTYEIVGSSLSELCKLEEQLSRKESVHVLTKDPEIGREVREFRQVFKIQLQQLVELRLFLGSNFQSLASSLEDLESSSRIPPKY
ncbi:hypothetical protein HWI79_306 [Cryptosporidium felis]|nr:hypothetical protein HWI79_306 [Cryptosporidium felis]